MMIARESVALPPADKPAFGGGHLSRYARSRAREASERGSTA